jgi:hypothetical protein
VLRLAPGATGVFWLAGVVLVVEPGAHTTTVKVLVNGTVMTMASGPSRATSGASPGVHAGY